MRPLNHLLPMTTRWAELLPELSRPVMLMRLYPRIANRLASAWRDVEAARAVFDDLLIDRRGGRQGFPPFVQAELMHLRTLLYRAESAARS